MQKILKKLFVYIFRLKNIVDKQKTVILWLKENMTYICVFGDYIIDGYAKLFKIKIKLFFSYILFFIIFFVKSLVLYFAMFLCYVYYIFRRGKK